MRYDLYGRKSQYYGRVQNRRTLTDIIDRDTALIFSLIFLLKKESRDPMLILALLYILT
ncbi:MAG: hypothetical protein J6Q79_01545 [Clostridia bacterium]|nr:hypothetical protein [Clostridia bacterium]